MNCKSVQNRMSAYLDRELGGDELLQIRAHMSTCAECRAEADGFRTLKSLLGGVQCPEPPDGLADRLTANMLKQRIEEPRKSFRVSAMMFAGVTACSMLATLIVLNYGVGRSMPSTAPTSGSGFEASKQTPGNQETIDGPVQEVPIISAANYGPR